MNDEQKRRQAEIDLAVSMNILRDELVQAGVVDGNVPPLLMGNAVLKHVGTLRTQLAEAETENNELHALNARLAEILTGTANVLKGEPRPLMHHSWHDLAEWGRDARAVAMGYLAATAPGATHIERENLVLAVDAWRKRFARDLMETAEALAMLDKDTPP